MSVSTVRVCPACGQKNRVPARHTAARGTCGKCKTALPPAAEPLEADAALFDAVIGESPVPVLVDFWATWCGPCRMVAPEVERAARTAAGRAVVLKVDIDRNPDLAARYQVQSVPTFAVFDRGRPVRTQVGGLRADALLAMLPTSPSR